MNDVSELQKLSGHTFGRSRNCGQHRHTLPAPRIKGLIDADHLSSGLTAKVNLARFSQLS